MEALVFASDVPVKLKDLAKLADAPVKAVEEALEELKEEYATRGISPTGTVRAAAGSS